MRRGDRLVLRGLTFQVAAGGAVLVTGPNGAGKSTLLRVLAGLLPPAAGRIRLAADRDLARSDLAHHLGHTDGLKAALTAAENLRFAARLLGGSGSAPDTAPTPETALARFGLGHLADLAVGHLSAGQRRRVALARLLVAPRPLWLLDEPATALDAAARDGLAAAMAAHRAAGGMVVAATHAPLGLAGAATLELRPAGGTP